MSLKSKLVDLFLLPQQVSVYLQPL